MKVVNLKLEAFEGPLDLLIHLIEKNEIDIKDIPISELTDQYLLYLKSIEKRDMDNISEFLVMAATLIEIKTKMLLPKSKKEEDFEEIDPREELVNKLIEYKRYKEIANIFKDTEIFVDKVAFKNQETELIEKLIGEKLYKIEDILNDVTLEKLNDVFLEVIKRKELKVDKVRHNFGKIKKDNYTIENQVLFIMEILNTKKEILFSDIFKSSASKIEVIVTFLAVLEMIKTKMIEVIQKDICEDIYIFGF